MSATNTQQLPAQESKSSSTTGYSAIALSIVAFTTTPVILKFALGAGLPAIVITLFRLLLAALILTPIVIRRYRHRLRDLSRQDWLLSAAAGFWLSIHFICVITSLQYTSVLLSTVLVSTSPIWVAMLEVLFLKVKLHRLVWIALVVVLIGSMVIAVGGSTVTEEQIDTPETSVTATESNDLLGAGLAIGAALAIAIYLTIGRRARAKVPFVPYVWIIYGFGAMTALVFTAAMSLPVVGYTTDAYLWLLLVVFVPQLIGHSSVNFALGYLPATIVGISSQAVVVTSAIAAFFILEEVPQPLQFVGSMIVLVGIIMAVFGQGKSGKPKQAEDVT